MRSLLCLLLPVIIFSSCEPALKPAYEKYSSRFLSVPAEPMPEVQEAFW